MTHAKRVRVLLHLSTSGLVAVAAILLGYIPAASPGWSVCQVTMLAAALVILALGFMSNLGLISRVSPRICLLFLSLILSLALCEVAFRLIRFDFAREREAWLQSPPFYRQPTVPTGEVFFRRPGPETWTGQVRNTRLVLLNVQPNPYGTEPVITVRYNKVGFRNSDAIAAWDIAVAGDSFTELGFLRTEELFTTIMGRRLNARVLNLGTSYTGPLTQLSYLRDYGLSGSTKHTIIVFFEGNDLTDLVSEYNALIRWREGGNREYREFKRQHSAMRALYGLLMKLGRRLGRQPSYVNAYFISLHGKIPVTLAYAPPGRADIPADTMRDLHYFFDEYAKFGRDRHLTVWLAYMPSKERVLYGHLELADVANDTIRRWRPTDLPEVISELCEQYGVRFIDLTPALTRETNRTKQLLYNSILDTHLNAQGSLVVGESLALCLGTKYVDRRPRELRTPRCAP